jgi:probable HAF family extracellular repeat protein
LIAGYSSNGQLDPLVFGFPQARAVLWRGRHAIDLGSFGGNESTAYSVNSRGQVAGVALNDIADPYSFFDYVFCGSPNGTQTRAFLWDEENGMQDLGTLGGNDALGFFVNEAGQVAGISYTDSTPSPPTGLPTFRPFLWEKGKGMQDLGTIGGAAVFNISGLNRRGQVVGTQTLAGDATWHPFLWDGKKLLDLGTFGGDQDWGNWINDAGEVLGQGAFGGDIWHAFLWKNGEKTDLGLLPGDTWSEPAVINSQGQIVGSSGTANSQSAVLWEHGQIVDLNTLVDPGSGLFLYAGLYINDPGEIAAFAGDSSGNNHDVLLIPCDADRAGVEGCDYSSMDASASALVRPALRETILRPSHTALWRRNTRFHLPTVGPRN